MRLLRHLLPFILLFALFAGGTLSAAEPDPALLARIEQLRQTAKTLAPQLWPGWDPLATPLAIHEAPGMTVLVGHPSPPPNFRRITTAVVSAPVYVADSTQGIPLANTSGPFAGAVTSFFSYTDFMRTDAAEGIALAIHELFHAHARQIAPGKGGDVLVVLWGEYPEFSARNRALLSFEGTTLSEGMAAKSDDGAREDVAAFLGLRAERRKDLPPDVPPYESGEEASEGLARYIELRTLQLMPAGGSAAGDTAAAIAKRVDALKQLNTLPSDRERFYVLGMAQAVLLDRVRPQWKSEYQSTPALLDDLLRKSVEALSAKDTDKLMDKLDYKKALAEQEQFVSQRLAEGSARLHRLMTSGKQRVLFEISGVKGNLKLKALNPNSSIMLTPTQVAHTFLWLELGALPGSTMQLQFNGVPAIYDRDQDSIWCMLPPDSVKKAIDAFAKATGPDAGLFSVQAPGVVIKTTGVQLDKRGVELRVRPAADLKKEMPYKKPEFVKPEAVP